MDLLAVELPPLGSPLALERQPAQLLHLPCSRRRGCELLEIFSNDLVEALALALCNFAGLLDEPLIHGKGQVHRPPPLHILRAHEPGATLKVGNPTGATRR